MFVNNEKNCFELYNPLLGEAYHKYLNLQHASKAKFSLEDILAFSTKQAELLIKELENHQDKEYIIVDNYLQIVNRINQTQKAEILKTAKLIVNNQNEFFNKFLELINASLNIMSDEQSMEKEFGSEKDMIKKAYFPAVIRIQKTVLGEFRKELEKGQKSSWSILAKIPILNYMAFGKRTKGFIKLNRAMAATNIVSIRLTSLFDKNKIKKEITQAYNEFAEANMLTPKYKFDKYSEYIANAIKT